MEAKKAADRPGDDATNRRGRGRGRRPSAEVRDHVLSAAGDLLTSAGMSGFTIERVAAQAGVSKTTIHKWWPSKGALALDAYFHSVEATLAFPETGDIKADLTTQIRSFARLVTKTPSGKVIAQLIGQAQSDPVLAAALVTHYAAPRRALAVEAMKRAQSRGQLRSDIDLEAVVDQLWGACYARLLIPSLPITQDFATNLVSNLMRGLQVTPDT